MTSRGDPHKGGQRSKGEQGQGETPGGCIKGVAERPARGSKRARVAGAARGGHDGVTLLTM